MGTRSRFSRFSGRFWHGARFDGSSRYQGGKPVGMFGSSHRCAGARFGAAIVVAAFLVACERDALPDPSSPGYGEAVTAFYTGVAAIQVGHDERAEDALQRVAQLAPGEPAADANLALIAYEQRRLDEAARRVDRALSGAPEDVRIRILAALIDRAGGRLDEAIQHLDAAEPTDRRAVFMLAGLLEERGSPADVARSQQLLDALLETDSTNVFLLVATARRAARHGDQADLDAALTRLETQSTGWSVSERDQLERVRAAADRPEEAGAELTFLAALLEPLPAYAEARDAIAVSEQQPDIVVTELLRLPTPTPRPPAPDLELSFAERPIDLPAGAWFDVRPVWLGESIVAGLASAEPSALWLTDETGTARADPIPYAPDAAEGIAAFAALDFEHTFRMGLALAGSQGLRLLRQDDDGTFAELAPGAVPENVARGVAYTGVWAADVDVDGDMDLVLAPRGEPPFVLRNQGDGTFDRLEPFDDRVGELRQFVWGDLDNDGVPDAVLLDAAGQVHVFRNPRQDLPRFERWPAPDELGPTHAIALGDLDGDGTFDLLGLREDGDLVRARLTREGWQTTQIADWPDFTPEPDRDARLIVADIDNNGALDVVASSDGRSQIWLADSEYRLVPHESLPIHVTAAADLTGGGQVVLLGIDAEGRPVRLSGRPTRPYFAFTLAPRAADQPGDRRVNTFGIGGEAEVRAGMLYQKQPITSPVVHFGIGEHTGVNVARILWPNGIAQAEFDLLAAQGGEPMVAPQRLKGSCPWLFAFDGEEMGFVTDIIWRTAVGLRINAYGSSSIIHSEDWVKIRGAQLSARDGYYELSITGELWESHFFDHVALLAVDHPVGTEVFVDERFFLPPPELMLHPTGRLQPIAGAWDSQGQDVTSVVAARDERYVDTFELGDFQGVAHEHFLEVDLGDDAPADAPLLLVAHGWVYPTDGSINFALGQGSHDPPRGIQVEVPDDDGGWTVLHADLGMPAGKTKNVLIDLTGAFREDGPRRVRLRTTMEIYWDHIAWAEARPETELRITRLLPEEADLRYRGFSRTRQDGRRAPELPEYDVVGTAPLWRDLEGYYTRYGDVLPLLAEVDDRYVIMNAGDELRLRFAAPPEPPAGWVRDYVLVSDGWVKDGDFNNGFSSTLLPLPSHGMTEYDQPPGRLEDDPVYQRHPQDWREYHIRYVSPRSFHDALSRTGS